MTEKRFTVYKTIGMLHCFYVNDDLTDKVVIDQILHKYEADRLCKKLNELCEENKQLIKQKKELQKSINNFIELEEENEELKANCKNYDWYKKYKELLNENEQLKKDLVRTKVVLDSLQETYSELLKIIPKG